MCEIFENLSLENINGEIWKEICGYDSDYFVSNLGRVKSFKYDKKTNTDVRILKQIENNRGYLQVSLSKNGKPKNKQIHTLMYETHVEKTSEGYVVHHIDDNKINNILENFQMMTKGEHTILHNKNKIVSEESKKKQSEKMKGENNSFYNKKHSEKTLKLMSEKKKGENHPRVKLTEKDVIRIRKLDEGNLTQKEIAKMFGVKPNTISNIKNRKIWKHIK